MSSFSTRLELPYLTTGAGDNLTVHNRALRNLDFLVMPVVVRRDLSAPPGVVSAGEMFVVNGTGTGSWETQDGNLACWTGSEWVFIEAVLGMQVYVSDEKIIATYLSGTSWKAISPEAIFSGQKNTTQSVSTSAGTYTSIEWNQQLVDISNSEVYSHSTSTNPDQITLLEAGTYEVDVNVALEATTSAQFSQIDVEVFVAGSSVAGAKSYGLVHSTSAPKMSISLHVIVLAAASNVLQVKTTRRTGTSATINILADTRISIRKIA